MTCREYIIKQGDEAHGEFIRAISEDRFGDACVWGKRAADLDAIYMYHEYHGGW